MQHYLYQITNLKNDMIYIGVHPTINLQKDTYMGSRVYLNRAYEKYGKENSRKDILEFFGTQGEAFTKEASIVDELFVKRKDTYNILQGGQGLSSGSMYGKDSSGVIKRVSLEDSRWKTGELVGANKGLSYNNGMMAMSDKDGNTFQASNTHPKYMSGEWAGANTGIKRSEETKRIQSEKRKGKTHSQKTKDKISKSKKGQDSNKRWIKKGQNSKFIFMKDIPSFLEQGWERGKITNWQ